MALQWTILAYLLAFESAVFLIISLPSPNLLKSRLVSVVSFLIQPLLSVVPFAAFQLLDIYWKSEHRLSCTSSEICTAAERDRHEKSVYKAQRNFIMCAAVCLLYWCIYRVCKYYKDLQNLEEVEKRYKDL
ncbi:hypothetical protein vseg_005863 [Gypsophila vaccaria]